MLLGSKWAFSCAGLVFNTLFLGCMYTWFLIRSVKEACVCAFEPGEAPPAWVPG